VGIGGAIFLIAIGAILAFAVHLDTGWLDLNVVGWVLMLAGLAVLGFTVYFWQDRRRRRRPSIVEETRLVHDPGPVPPDPPDVAPPP
jgi:hypothetical protein